MIIYGIKSTEVASEKLLEKCVHCGNYNTVSMIVFQKYFHVFWIPFFPISKTGVSHCSHCKQVLKKKEFPQGLNLEYQNIKSKLKAPKWTFIGLGLIFLLIVKSLF